MSEALYDLVITRHSSVKPVEQLVQDLLRIMEETGDNYLEYKLSEALLFGQGNSVILGSITFKEGQHFQQLFLEQKVETRLNPTSKKETRKPEKIPADDLDVEDFAPEHEEIELPYEETPDQPVNKQKKQKIITGASLVAVLLTGAAGYFIFEGLNKETGQETQQPTLSQNTDTAVGTRGKDTSLNQTTTPKSVVAAEIKNTTTKQKTTATPGLSPQQPKQTAAVTPDLSPQQPKQTAAVTPGLSPQQLEKLTAILKPNERTTFGYTDGKQYLKSRPRLNRLLELDKPSLGLVFAENIKDPYAAALSVLVVANSEQQKKRNLHYDEILLTMRGIAARPDSEHLTPLLTSALSQAHTMTGDNKTADKLLERAIQEAKTGAEKPEQEIQWLTRMLINHQHFNHSHGAKKLIDTLEAIASKTPLDAPENQLTNSRIYSHLASIAIGRGDKKAAARWLKKIPVKKNREYLQAYLNEI